MPRSGSSLFAVVCLLASVGCTTGSGSETPGVAGPVCVKACDAKFDACSLDCENHVDNNLYSQECLDKLGSSKKTCEES